MAQILHLSLLPSQTNRNFRVDTALIKFACYSKMYYYRSLCDLKVSFMLLPPQNLHVCNASVTDCRKVGLDVTSDGIIFT